MSAFRRPVEPDLDETWQVFVGEIVVRRLDGNNWGTVEPLTYAASRQIFHIPAVSITDFASVPRVWAWLIPRAGAAVPAAILHDYMWGEEVPKGRIAYREVDGIFRQALRTSGVPFVLRWLCWTAGAMGSPHLTGAGRFH